MKVLELFAGSRSFSKAAEERGHQTFSVDIEAFEGIDLVRDIEFLTAEEIPIAPDVIWASPPCTTYSMAAISTHRNDGEPKTEFANKSDWLVKNTLYLCSEFDCLYYIENPRAYLRKMPFMQGINRATVWYCQYGDSSAKPTDIWSNNIRSIFNLEGWQPRPECHNGNYLCHHEPAPRGSKTGTQGKSSAYDRSIVPKELCEEILMASELHLNKTFTN